MIPKRLCNYTVGDILGYEKGDGGLTSHVETWSICKGPVEAIYIDKDVFDDLWALHN